MRKQLEAGLAGLGVNASPVQIDGLIRYLELLIKWNKAYNLTAITEPARMVTHHLLDSLSILPFMPARGRCLDVGTGAGLPGIPLAILMPDSQWVLLDSNGKKTRFVQQVIAECRLGHVRVVQSRVQDYHAGSDFDLIVSRAYASLHDFVASVEHLWGESTQLISMKTEPAAAEIDAVTATGLDVNIHHLDVPGIRERRSLITIKRQTL
jgi:16S rRNA (guanine527-N7)-methyltransferase